MYIIRTLHIRKYSAAKGRFGSDCFKKYGEGISVFDAECATRVSGCICKHIEAFYQSTVTTPIFYWRIDEDELKNFAGFENVIVNQKDSDTLDFCHYDICNVEDKKSQNFAKKYCIPPNVYICQNDKEVILDEETFINLHQIYQTSFNEWI